MNPLSYPSTDDGVLVRKKGTLHRTQAQKTRCPGQASRTGNSLEIRSRNPAQLSPPPQAGQAHARPHQSTHAYPAGSRVPRAPEKGSWCIPSSDTTKASCFLLSWRLGGKGICFHPNLCEVLTLSPHFYLDFFIPIHFGQYLRNGAS